MMVLILESVPSGLRGEISRWLIEPKAGVFVGKVSAMVRDKLWQKACEHSKGGGVTMIYSTNNEQGYTFRTFGETSRSIVDWEGLMLVRIDNNSSS
ncbi:MAG: type I-E CRISPR-associated endoribonuclease Cas2e [Armatimonadota bacterium]